MLILTLDRDGKVWVDGDSRLWLVHDPSLVVTVKCKTSRRFGLGEFETTPRRLNRVGVCRKRLYSRNNIAVAVVFIV